MLPTMVMRLTTADTVAMVMTSHRLCGTVSGSDVFPFRVKFCKSSGLMVSHCLGVNLNYEYTKVFSLSSILMKGYELPEMKGKETISNLLFHNLNTFTRLSVNIMAYVVYVF